jgi:hypothetical protein
LSGRLSRAPYAAGRCTRIVIAIDEAIGTAAGGDNAQHSAFPHEHSIGLGLDLTPEAADCLRLRAVLIPA